MDARKAFPMGSTLSFPGMNCIIEGEIGRGSNAIVYKAYYLDLLNQEQKHIVLIKELFPLDPKGRIVRDAQLDLHYETEATDIWQYHRHSFEYGNEIHLKMLEKHPDIIGANQNTFALHNTLYTVLGFTGGYSLGSNMATTSLKQLTLRMLGVLDALEVFHENGFLHLDIAPDNLLLVGKKEQVLLIDYNSAYDLSMPDEMPYASIKAGFTAPEIRSGKGILPHACMDLYSVTAVFYACLTGVPLTPFQMSRPVAPDVSSVPCLQQMPETVCSMVAQILKNGLQTLPRRRYQSIEELRKAFKELLDRIDGIGITHWALWESGKRTVRKMIEQNVSMRYLLDENALFPANLIDQHHQSSCMDDYFEQLLHQTGKHALLLAGGGMGKTTALFHTIANSTASYAPTQPAVMYISLYGQKGSDAHFIQNRILEHMRFHADTTSFEDARHQLGCCMEKPITVREEERPTLLLLLDGLNEATGDTKALYEEIEMLSNKPGISMLITSRNQEPSLSFETVTLCPLTQDDVTHHLHKEGLLMPENEALGTLLQIPLLLSMFIGASKAEQKQLHIQTQDELMQAYLNALQHKEMRNMPQNSDEKWQMDVAVSLLLPAIAKEVHTKQHALNDEALLEVITKYYRLLSAPLLRRAFPRWIGHSKAIKSQCKDAEQWYGLLVQEWLWRRLGLLTQDETGCYHVMHQSVAEYLINIQKQNDQQIWKKRRLKRGLLAGCVLGCSILFYLVYTQYIMPAPYAQLLAENVFTSSVHGYVTAGTQYEAFHELVDCAINNPDRYDYQWALYEHSSVFTLQSQTDSILQLEAMLATGKVMPWSQKSFAEESFREIIALASERESNYALYANVLTYVMTNETAYRIYGVQYPLLLSDVLDADAQVSALLFEIVCQPHLIESWKYYDTVMATCSVLEEQNEFLSNTTSIDDLMVALDVAYGKSTTATQELLACGAIFAYQKYEEETKQ